MSLLVDGGALLLIAFLVWWFWLYRPAPRAPAAPMAGPGDTIDILVADGVYSPATIAVPAGRDTVLRFLRRDRSPCAAMVLIDGLGVSAELPIDQPLSVLIHPDAPGRFDFTCQMRMYRGTLVVTGVEPA